MKYVIGIMVLLVIGILLFKPKSKSLESLSEESTVDAQLSDQDAAVKALAVKAEEMNSANAKAIDPALPKPPNAQATSAAATPSPEDEANSPTDTPTPGTETSAQSALSKLNTNKIKGVFRIPKSVNPNPNQKKLMEEVEKKYTPKLEEQLNKMEGVLSDDQKKARNEALMRSVFDGDRPDVKEAVIRNAMNLNGDQEQMLRDLNKDFYKMRNNIRQEMYKYLTPEQKQSLPPNWLGGKRGGKN